jgi:hypothetical protein
MRTQKIVNKKFLIMRAALVIGLALLSAICLSPAGSAKPVLTASQVDYISDLQGKQESISSIREDIGNIEKGLIKKTDLLKDGLQRIKEGISKLKLTGKDIAQMMPPSAKIYMEVRPMSGTLSPKTNHKTDK